MEVTTLPIRVDKSHLVTIGERLYAESVELIRELVNNAYDADATDVQVTLTDEMVRVVDNGLGMDLEGLREYFTIGTPDKRLNPRSSRFGRPRIGQFGIGKFATLSACERFTVFTQGACSPPRSSLTSRSGAGPATAGICRCGCCRMIRPAARARP